MHDKLLKFIESGYHFNADEVDKLKLYFEPVEFHKNTIIETEGDIPQYLYYIVSGYLRLFHFDEHGNEITTHINCPP